MVIYAGVRGYLDSLVIDEIPKFEKMYLEYMKSTHADLMKSIKDSGEMSDKQDEQIG